MSLTYFSIEDKVVVVYEPILEAVITRALDHKSHSLEQELLRYIQYCPSGGDLIDLVPEQNPCLTTIGYNNLNGSRSRCQFPTLNSERLNSERLIGLAVNGGSKVYLPTITISLRTFEMLPPAKIPHFLSYYDGLFWEAAYDVKTAAFVRNPIGSCVAGASLQLVGPVKAQYNYVQYPEIYLVPDNISIFRTDSVSAKILGSVARQVFGARDFIIHLMVGKLLENFEEQIFYHFSKLGSLSRNLSEGDSVHRWISEQQINGFSYAGYADIKNAVSILKDEPDKVAKLRNFLLYKALEESLEGGSAIVGDCVADAGMHYIPFVAVAARSL